MQCAGRWSQDPELDRSRSGRLYKPALRGVIAASAAEASPGSRSPGHPADLFAKARPEDWAGMPENRAPAPRAARSAASPACARRRHAVRHATRCGGTMNDAVLRACANVDCRLGAPEILQRPAPQQGALLFSAPRPERPCQPGCRAATVPAAPLGPRPSVSGQINAPHCGHHTVHTVRPRNFAAPRAPAAPLGPRPSVVPSRQIQSFHQRGPVPPACPVECRLSRRWACWALEASAAKREPRLVPPPPAPKFVASIGHIRSARVGVKSPLPAFGGGAYGVQHRQSEAPRLPKIYFQFPSDMSGSRQRLR